MNLDAVSALLADTLPKPLQHSLLIGEESVARDPALMNALQSDCPVRMVDPLDGTGNFVAGLLCASNPEIWRAIKDRVLPSKREGNP